MRGRVLLALLLQSPYDFEVGENRNGRMEFLFLEHTYRWLKPGGVLALVVPGDRLSTCAEILAVHCRDKAIYRLSEPESIRHKQIVVFGVRRTRRERDQLKDWDVQRAKTKLLGLATGPALDDIRLTALAVGKSGAGVDRPKEWSLLWLIGIAPGQFLGDIHNRAHGQDGERSPAS